ncbi:MAG TPA: SAM-dependent methyltransferase [Polyangiaceae bacterium]|nr:SAM-dependent methyltransferase [Polyangiaceae bacterium]
MRERRPSQTASMVALVRALANDGFTTVPGFRDPPVAALLSPGWRCLYRRMSARLRQAPPERAARAIARFDALSERVAMLDVELTEAIDAGAEQVVILGAGLDTRAYRMEVLRGCAVFEVDHPATQAFKRRKAAALPPFAHSLAYVPVDFERGGIDRALASAGFRSERASVWVWEGVVMYLTHAALRASLREIAKCAAAGSRVLVNYHLPTIDSQLREQRIRTLLLAAWGERQIGLRTTEAMHTELRDAGFAVLRDTGAAAWATRLGAKAPVGHPGDVARLVVAKRS